VKTGGVATSFRRIVWAEYWMRPELTIFRVRILTLLRSAAVLGRSSVEIPSDSEFPRQWTYRAANDPETASLLSIYRNSTSNLPGLKVHDVISLGVEQSGTPGKSPWVGKSAESANRI
jgi:hypothetical protein